MVNAECGSGSGVVFVEIGVRKKWERRGKVKREWRDGSGDAQVMGVSVCGGGGCGLKCGGWVGMLERVREDFGDGWRPRAALRPPRDGVEMPRADVARRALRVGVVLSVAWRRVGLVVQVFGVGEFLRRVGLMGRWDWRRIGGLLYIGAVRPVCAHRPGGWMWKCLGGFGLWGGDFCGMGDFRV